MVATEDIYSAAVSKVREEPSAHPGVFWWPSNRHLALGCLSCLAVADPLITLTRLPSPLLGTDSGHIQAPKFRQSNLEPNPHLAVDSVHGLPLSY